METAGGIADQNIGIPGFCGGNGIIDHGCRVRSLLLGDQIHAGPVSPLGELFDGSGPEGIGSRQDHPLSVGLQLVGQFSDGGGLSYTIDADHQDHGFPVFKFIRVFAQVHFFPDAVDEHLAALGRILDVLLLHGLF